MKSFGLKKEFMLLGALALISMLLKGFSSSGGQVILWPWPLILIFIWVIFLRRIYKIEIIGPESVIFHRVFGKIVVNPGQIRKIEELPRKYVIYLDMGKITVTDCVYDLDNLVKRLLEMNDEIRFEKLSIFNVHKDSYIGGRIIFYFLFAGIVLGIAIFLLVSGILKN